MALDLLTLAAGLLLLAAGADTLVRGGASLARRLGLTPLVVGLTVVAFGTSAPEMVVSVAGSYRGQGDVALGNVVGSNIFNVGVVLALAALVSPVRVKLGLLRLDAPLVIAVSLLAVWVTRAVPIPRAVGVLLLLLLAGYTALSVVLARREASAEIAEEFDEGVPSPLRSAWIELALIVAGLALLVLGSTWLVGATTSIARSFGVAEAVIGLTIVAAGTSTPELATSLVAALRGQSDIAVGNVIGSNIFNLLGILGLATALRPLAAPGIERSDLWVMLAFAVAMLPLLWTGRRLLRWEGALLLAGYVAYVWSRWPAG